MQLSLDAFEQQIDKLPSLSPVISRLLYLLQNKELSITSLAKELSRDPSLTAQTLRIANSSFYGLSSQIYDIKHACALLGLHTVHGIIIRVEVIQKFPISNKKLFDHDFFWQHAIGTATAAEMLADYCDVDSQLAYIAGLLHDLGKLILAVYYANDYQKVLTWQVQHKSSFYQAELAVLNFDHCEIGAKMAKHCKLPESLATSIKYHHRITNKSSSLTYLIHIANVLCHDFNEKNIDDDFLKTINPNALALLKIEREEAKNVLSDIYQKCAESKSLII